MAPNTTQHTHTWARQVGKGGQKGDGNFVFGGVVWYSLRSPETCQDQVGQGIDGDGGAFFFFFNPTSHPLKVYVRAPFNGWSSGNASVCVIQNLPCLLFPLRPTNNNKSRNAARLLAAVGFVFVNICVLVRAHTAKRDTAGGGEGAG